MQFIPVHTRTLIPPKDDLLSVFEESLTDVRENDIILITSKVVAIHQGRCLPIEQVSDKDALIQSEAEKYIDRDRVPGRYAILTLKHHTLIASAGVDESNSNGHYILWPTNIDEITRFLWDHLRRKYGVKNLGVILTDSHSLPLRYGVLGISISHCGFEPLVDLRGKKDLFGRTLKMTLKNIPDALAALGVSIMGEADEGFPLLIVRGFSVSFTERDTLKDFRIPCEKDLYKPLLDVF